jgi:hypothetical protein
MDCDPVEALSAVSWQRNRPFTPGHSRREKDSNWIGRRPPSRIDPNFMQDLILGFVRHEVSRKPPESLVAHPLSKREESYLPASQESREGIASEERRTAKPL